MTRAGNARKASGVLGVRASTLTPATSPTSAAASSLRDRTSSSQSTRLARSMRTGATRRSPPMSPSHHRRQKNPNRAALMTPPNWRLVSPNVAATPRVTDAVHVMRAEALAGRPGKRRGVEPPLPTELLPCLLRAVGRGRHRGAVAGGDIADRIVRRPLCAPAADHQDGRGAVTGSDDHVRGARRAVQEVPLADRHLLVLDDRKALAAEHDEELLCVLGVVGRGGLAGTEDAHVDPQVAVALVGTALAEEVRLARLRVLEPLDLREVLLEPAA